MFGLTSAQCRTAASSAAMSNFCWPMLSRNRRQAEGRQERRDLMAVIVGIAEAEGR